MFEDDDEIEEYGDIDEEDAYIPGVSDANADSGEAVDSKKDSTNNKFDSLDLDAVDEPQELLSVTKDNVQDAAAPSVLPTAESTFQPTDAGVTIESENKAPQMDSLKAQYSSNSASEITPTATFSTSSVAPTATRVPSPIPSFTPSVIPSTASSTESKSNLNRLSKNRKLTAEYLGIAEEDIAEIEEVYDIAADPVSGNFYTDNIEDAIAALGLTAGESEIKEIIATADPKDSGIVDHYLFVEIMALKYQERRKESAATSRHNAETGTKVSGNYRNREEMEHAFGLFIEGRQTNQFIAMQDLRNAAILAKDNVTDEDLQEMLRVASGNEYGTVSFENFAVVMQQSGAIS